MKPGSGRVLRSESVIATLSLAAIVAYYFVRFRDALLMFFFLDDFWNLGEAAHIHLRSPLDLVQLLQPAHNGFTLYRPLTQTDYFFVLHALFGYDATGYHAVQLLAHVLNAWLVLLITRRLTESTGMGLAAALIYASAPGHLQAVYWISTFSMTGTALVLLLMLWWWLSTAGWQRVAGVSVAQAAALLASEHGVMGPALLAAVALLGPQPEPWRRVVKQAALPALLVAVYAGFKLVYLGWLHPLPPGFPYAPSFDPAGWVLRTGRYAAACFDVLEPMRVGAVIPACLGAVLLLLPFVAAWLRLRRGPQWSLLAVGSTVFVIGLLPVLPLAAHAYDYYIGTAAFGAALIVLGGCRVAGRHWRLLAAAAALVTVLLDFTVRGEIIRRDDNVQLIFAGSAAAASWVETLGEVAARYPQLTEVSVPRDVITQWLFDSGGDRFFRTARPAVRLFDRRQPPGPGRAVIWSPLDQPVGDLPGWTPRLRWLRALAGTVS